MNTDRNPTHSRWKNAILGFIVGFAPLGLAQEISPFASRFIETPGAAPDPLVKAFHPDVLKTTQSSAQRTGAGQLLNLARFFALGRTPLQATGQIRSLDNPEFQVNWAPGMDLPYSFNHVMQNDLAHLDPNVRAPEGYNPFATPDLRTHLLRAGIAF